MKTLKMDLVYAISMLLFLIQPQVLMSQNNHSSGTVYIQKLIEDNKLELANTVLQKELDNYRAEKNLDSLVKYIFLVGSLKLAHGNHDIAIKKAEAFSKELQQYNNPYINKEVLLEIAWIYDDAGYTKKAYKTVEKALEIAKNITDQKQANISVIYHNLGYLASNLGDIVAAKKHYSMSIKIMKKEESKNFEGFQKTYNALGGMMWYSAKLDSSLYYFKLSYNMLEHLEKDPMNSYYRPALVKMNIAVINHALGHVNDAITASKEVISSFQKYMDVSKDESQKLRALKLQLTAIDNLGSFYHSIGEFEKADKLITYSYQKKLKTLANEDVNITISQIISAQAKLGIRDFIAANNLIDQAIIRINNSKNTQLYWHASALSTKADISDKLNDIKNAEKYYKAADSLYRISLGKNEYTRDFLDEIIDMSLFYAKINKPEKAINLAKETYSFIKTSNFKNTLQEFHHILNLAEVYFKLNNYPQAITYSNEALNLLNNKNLSTTNFTDSIQIQYRKPKALLINAKSKYEIQDKTSETFLKDLLHQIETGISVLEQRKEIITTYDELSILITENNDLFNFSKQLHIDLYHLTKDSTYLTKFLTIHESSAYNRIRSRLNLKTNLAFANVPNAVLKREMVLKNALNTTINDTNNANFNSFFKANTNWASFLDSLKSTYPKYYKMRYASIKKPLDNIKNNIPENTTVVRYTFVDNSLYAILISPKSTLLFSLDTFKNTDDILDLQNEKTLFTNNFQTLNTLYKSLWQPFENKINTQHVIIIPDRALFNLNFEMLTPTLISSNKEFATKSLLSKHTISYNYSLFLVNKNLKISHFEDNFIAFVPEFNNKMKQDYKIKIKDSIEVDKAYLTLLPQPFTKDLAKNTTRLFDGESFLNEKSTEHIFKNSAKEHKIIHIGTHAESNNISPELSRLVFAKSTDTLKKDDGYLYTYEIYNMNLSSNIAILTACETGKPTYQAGEGMISLAHAFNYAGSESILTSLWKVDEQSSAEIIANFYTNIKKGMPKDKALQQAKLKYISTAKGRTIHPQYWAGLVLIGDTTAIEMTSNSHLVYWIFGLAVLFLLVLFINKKFVK